MVTRLRAAGCVAAEEEAQELLGAADDDPAVLEDLVSRRCGGEPIAWLTGSVVFCGETVLVHPGVYVPRWQSEPMALEAAARLPEQGVAVDLCTGSGALALVMMRRRPGARVMATEIDTTAAACARANGVDVHVGDMTGALPPSFQGSVDVVTGVVPYVPADALQLLPRDVLAYEPRSALDGGQQGVTFLERAIAESAPVLRSGGSLLLEIGGDQHQLLAPRLERHGFDDVTFACDDDGDLRALYARRR